ncbi:MAG: cAMP-binding protein [Magnetovibrio sp.]|nr:cAMP-binding protein [Magnetovibrio sp.]|tara:strand:+ start:844 stop:1227 length:384 start_codon:yes stop_codon:yes gene_type:complete
MSDKVLERKTFQEGDLLFKEGDEPTHALIIQTGEVQILLNAEKDDEVTLATIGPGGIIGEMALLDSSNRMATARAKSGGAAIIVTKQVFDMKMQKTDPFVRGLLLILADRSRQLSAKQSYSNDSSES